MGKKKIVTTEEVKDGAPKVEVSEKALGKKRVESAILHVRSTYNNTALTLTDRKGNVVATSSSGSLGFKGAKKGTPFAAAKVGETLALKAQALGVKEIAVVVNGVGLGRESGIRGFISKGVNIVSIKDMTAVPHNGPKPKKPRRV